MANKLAALTLVAGTLIFGGIAHSEQEDEIVRLPERGEVVDKIVRARVQASRLKPGGGLLISFDTDEDGIITPAEVDAGIPLAFAAADADENGQLTVFEQRAWAEQLPTRDDTLRNPVRFDPNLDRLVDLDEFSSVVEELARGYADEETGNITATDLKAAKPIEPEEALETPAAKALQRRAERRRSGTGS